MTTQADLQRQFYEMLMDSQWWSADALRDYQRTQLSQLLRHARKNVPFYEHRLDAVLKPNGDIDWDRWHEIPIVKRQDMIDHREAMQARELPPGHGPTAVFETSGTSGLAIKLTTTRLATIANNGLRWRSNVWNGLDWSKRLCIRDGDDPQRGALPFGTAVGPWGPSWDKASASGSAWVINKLVPGEGILDFFVRHRCAYINTGPKTAHTLALDAVRLRLNISIEAFNCQGESVGDDDRAICKEVFGARLVEHYSSKESGQMAHVCPAGRLHVNSECMLLEIVDDRGRPCEPGETGRVIVTAFFSTAQPLIRYEQGDMAVMGTKCSCGRDLPAIASVSGRQFAVFRHPDGRALVQVLPMAARDALGCEFLQVAQVGPLSFEVRYVPRDWDKAGDDAEFVRQFRALYFDDAEVLIKRVPEIPVGPGGKFREYTVEYHG